MKRIEPRGQMKDYLEEFRNNARNAAIPEVFNLFDVSNERVTIEAHKKVISKVVREFKTDKTKMASKKITLQQLIGPSFDINSKEPPPFDPETGYLNNDGSYFGNGELVFGMLKAPYIPHSKEPRLLELFYLIGNSLLNNFKEKDLDIYEWNTDFCELWEDTFFNKLWTIYNKEKKLLIVILFSHFD